MKVESEDVGDLAQGNTVFAADASDRLFGSSVLSLCLMLFLDGQVNRWIGRLIMSSSTGF